MNPLFLAYSPPVMLPTTTLNPTATAAAAAKSKFKRSLGTTEETRPLNKDATHIKREIERPLLHRIDLNMMWWASVGLTVFGGAAYLL